MQGSRVLSFSVYRKAKDKAEADETYPSRDGKKDASGILRSIGKGNKVVLR